jgi:hypothetical protein
VAYYCSAAYKNRKYAAVSGGFVADETVSGELVSEADFPANREIYREVDKILGQAP